MRAPREDSPVAEPPVTSPQAERDPTLRAGLALPEDAAGTAYTPLPLTAYDSTPTFQSLDVRASTEPDSQASLGRLPGSGRISPTQNGLAPSEDGLLPAYALGAGSGVANLPDVTAGGASAASSPLTVPGVPALAAPSQRPLASPLIEPPEMVRKKNPYESIPSLYDMYVQAVARPPEPRRFGAEVFESAARDSQAIPMDLPAARTM